MDSLAIVAGGGKLPQIAFEEAKKLHDKVLVFGIRESLFDPQGYGDVYRPINITKIGSILSLCKKEKIKQILLMGKVEKKLLYENPKFDLKTIWMLAKMKNKVDYSIFHAISEEFEKKGILFQSQKKYLKSLFPKEGRYTSTKLSSSTLEDIIFGMDLAKKMADLDIGQSVVVLDQSPVAIEAAEGTDLTIQRAGELTQKKKGKSVLCKSSKHSQDDRFDLPTIGLETLKKMYDSGIGTLAFRENDTIVIDFPECIEFANRNKINILSVGNTDLKKLNAKLIKF